MSKSKMMDIDEREIQATRKILAHPGIKVEDHRSFKRGLSIAAGRCLVLKKIRENAESKYGNQSQLACRNMVIWSHSCVGTWQPYPVSLPKYRDLIHIHTQKSQPQIYHQNNIFKSWIHGYIMHISHLQ